MPRNSHVHYENDAERWPDDAFYRVKGSNDFAWRVYGWHVEPDEDTEWTGYEVRTGNVVAVIVGDDYRHVIDPEDLEPIEREEFCGVCGQIGCGHDGLERGTGE